MTSLRNGIEPAFVKRMAAQEPFQPQENPPDESVPHDGLGGEIGAGRMESAMVSEEGRQSRLVNPDEEKGEFSHLRSKRPADRLDRRPVIVSKDGPGSVQDRLAGDDQHVQRRLQQILVPSKKFSRPPAGPVPLNRSPDLPARHGGHARMALSSGEVNQGKIPAFITSSSGVKRGKFRLPADPLARSVRFYHSTARRLRPFCRRLLMTF